jgi:hypothetical protein
VYAVLKAILIAAAFLIGIKKSNAQVEFSSGQNILGLSIGIGGSMQSAAYDKQSPTIAMIYERGIWDGIGPGNIGLGAYLGYKSYNYRGVNPYGTYNYKWNYTVFGIRGAYHYDFIGDGKLDTYGGVMMGIANRNFRYSYSYDSYYYDIPKYSGTFIIADVFVGTRYYITPTIAVFGEASFNVSLISLGANINF